MGAPNPRAIGYRILPAPRAARRDGTGDAPLGDIVQVYRNLTKGVWSVRRGGRVIARERELVLTSCIMKVRESERQRAIREGHRNVHAWVEGDLWEAPVPGDLAEIGYNPFRAPTFTVRPGFEPIFSARFVVFAPDGKAFAVV